MHAYLHEIFTSTESNLGYLSFRYIISLLVFFFCFFKNTLESGRLIEAKAQKRPNLEQTGVFNPLWIVISSTVCISKSYFERYLLRSEEKGWSRLWSTVCDFFYFSQGGQNWQTKTHYSKTLEEIECTLSFHYFLLQSHR